ncbi:hypothetical protein BCS96_14670 [Vibrio breoganii]|nr:hypothetical protein BCU74_11585 [Vibrio breoganii]PMK33657.1 hypothetical protein BCU06_13380 [Vibrio breoganii]PML32942.1 hypothetical protein BCT78_15345 [Vibrio breoganii]PML90840.1 hypothetical protein BCT68_18115 [Vibrio breoganii]PMM16179.1 hypothetical protein BCT60_05495 [Vibrio breoganii]
MVNNRLMLFVLEVLQDACQLKRAVNGENRAIVADLILILRKPPKIRNLEIKKNPTRLGKWRFLAFKRK